MGSSTTAEPCGRGRPRIDLLQVARERLRPILEESPSLRDTDIAKRTGWSRSTVQRRLADLRKAGEIESQTRRYQLGVQAWQNWRRILLKEADEKESTMSSYEARVKPPEKVISLRGHGLEEQVLKTLEICSAVVGGTLGPGGMPVLIERSEPGLPPIPTKDGVSSFKAISLSDPIQHTIMEMARAAAIRTCDEAGDGTTTATIMVHALVSRVQQYCKKNPTQMPQQLVRDIETAATAAVNQINQDVVTRLQNLPPNQSARTLRSVARVSANGDDDLAGAVCKCFDVAGDDGNVTIVEALGAPAYAVERIDGYPLQQGWEDLGTYRAEFVNERATSRCVLEQPVVICFHGRLLDPNQIMLGLQSIGARYEQGDGRFKNVVLVATEFSETVIEFLAANFRAPQAINVYPLKVPLSPLASGQLDFLRDLAAYTGGRVVDPLTEPFERGLADDVFGHAVLFEANRARSNIIVNLAAAEREIVLSPRLEEVRHQVEHPESQLEGQIARERLARLTNGIARLAVVGWSSGDTKERRDRAEDAVCAARGALRHGYLPGGGWAFLRMAYWLRSDVQSPGADGSRFSPAACEILEDALKEPLRRLLSNSGHTLDETNTLVEAFFKDPNSVYNVATRKKERCLHTEILDSVPAVFEALRTAVSLNKTLPILNSVIAFRRDPELERRESQAEADFRRWSTSNPANERP